MSTQDSTRLLRRSEVAELLSVSARTLDRLARSGALPVVYIDRRPRYLAEDVAAFVTTHRHSSVDLGQAAVTSRIGRIRDALADGEHDLAEHLLSDLEADLDELEGQA